MTAVGDARKRQQAHSATETAPGDAQGSDRGADVVGRLSEAETANLCWSVGVIARTVTGSVLLNE